MIAFILIPGGWGMDRSSSIRHIPLFAYDVPKGFESKWEEKEGGKNVSHIHDDDRRPTTHGIL